MSTSRAVAFAALVLAFLVAGSPLRAEEAKDTADEAEVQFVLGNDAYLRRDFRSALAHYFASNRLAPNRNVLFNIGRAYEQLGQGVEAYRYYQSFADGATSPDEQRAASEALARVRPQVALLNATTSPPGATLFIDRKELGGYGATPRELALAPGTYRVILEMDGYEPYAQEGVRIAAGQRVDVAASLERVLGRLRIEGEPDGAQVRVETAAGPVVGSLPTTLDLPPGDHTVLVTRDGWVPAEVPVRVVAGEIAEATVRLQRQTGALVVQSDERDALILIDGKAAGFTPAVIDGVPSGRHEVSVSLEGFRPYVVTVDLAPDERELVEAELLVSEDVAAASRATESVQDAPASVSVIPEREMQAFGALNVAEAVAGERGVFLSDDGTYKSLGFRGFSPFGQYGNRLLVQIDGHTVNDDWIGSSYVSFDLLTDLRAIERVELVRGPGSTLYGTGAFFGVINLVTPDTAPRHPARVGAALVSEGLFRGTAGAGAPIGEDAGIWISGGALYGQDRDYFSPAYVGSAEAPDGVAHDTDGMVAGGALGRLWWRDLTVQWYFNQRDKDIPTGSFETIFGDPRAETFDRRAFVEVRYEPVLSDVAQLFTRLYYDHTRYEGTFPYPADEAGVNTESYEGDWLGAELRSVFRPLAGMRLTAGAEYQLHFRSTAEGSSENEGVYLDEEHPFHVLSVYGVADWAPLEWLAVSAGARFDGWWIDALRRADGSVSDRFMSSVNPRLALLFHPVAESTLKLLGGRAFRAPSIYELTYWDGGLTQVQSPELEPEVIWTGEVEYSHRLPADLTVTGSFFLNNIADLIEQAGGGTSEDPLRYVNQADDVWTLGGEVELSHELRQGWMFMAQYSVQHTRVGDVFDGQRLKNAPEHLGALKVVAPLARPEVLLANRLVVESGRLDREGDETDVALLWDLVLSGQVQAAHLRYAAGVRNLLDWRVAHPVGEDLRDVTLRQPGRTFFVDLSLHW